VTRLEEGDRGGHGPKTDRSAKEEDESASVGVVTEAELVVRRK
jgi:hypothetical protein